MQESPRRPDPLTDAERAELRRLWLAASPGRWEAKVLEGIGHCHLYAVAPDGKRWLVAMPNGAANTQLIAASRNALPRLFAEIDALRARTRPRTPVPIVGTVG